MKKYFDNLKFTVNEKEYELFFAQLENAEKYLECIKTFDFKKYEKYLNNKNYENVLNFSDLRSDDDEYIPDNQDRELFLKNVVEFNDEFVVLKNEK